LDVSGIGATTGLSGAAKMLAAAKAALGGVYSQANHDAVADSASQIQQNGTDCSGFGQRRGPPDGPGRGQHVPEERAVPAVSSGGHVTP
jgi:hypothetical protein